MLGDLTPENDVWLHFIDLPQEEDMLPRVEYGLLKDAFAGTQKALDNVCQALDNVCRSLALSDGCIQIELSEDGYDGFFRENHIHEILVHGLGKYGRMFVRSSKHASVEIIGFVDRNAESGFSGGYDGKPVYRPDEPLPDVDLVIAAMLDSDEVVRSYAVKGVRCISLRDLTERVLGEQGSDD